MSSDFNRVRWQCRRGMLELDLILNRFLETDYKNLPANLQAAFRALLELPDPDLWDKVRGSVEPQDADVLEVLALLRCER
jgi:antitoxin CptB